MNRRQRFKSLKTYPTASTDFQDCFTIVLLVCIISSCLIVLIVKYDPSHNYSEVESLQDQLISEFYSSKQLHENLTESQNYLNGSTEKVILFWGQFYSTKPLKMKCISSTKDMDFCSKKCTYTNGHDYLNISDAVVVHGREMRKVPFPQWRRENQRWVFLMFESTYNSKRTSVLSKKRINKWNAPGVFNWTMSYRSDSDIFVPYGKVLKIPDTPSISPNLNEIKNKSLVAWAVSNCNQSVYSNRNRLVEGLQRHLNVDIFGNCGPNPCPGGHPNDDPCESPEQCYKLMGSKYKFYLAFENSLCPEYITEKFFFPLKHGMVPVVLGPSREYFENIAPPNSFIHVDDFTTVSDLANYLIALNSDEAAYLRFFDWKKDYVIDDQFYFRRSWCSLCQKLYEADENPSPSKSYENIYEWWHENNPENLCSRITFENDSDVYKITYHR